MKQISKDSSSQKSDIYRYVCTVSLNLFYLGYNRNIGTTILYASNTYIVLDMK